MLKYFYDSCEQIDSGSDDDSVPANGKLFEALAIGRAGSEYMEKQGRYPVIFLSFKDIKELDWETSLFMMKQLIQDEYLKHDYLLESEKIKQQEKDYFKRIINLQGNLGEYQLSLQRLLIFLNRFYGKRVVILIDEYDAPVHAGFANKYYDKVITFMRNFLSGGLKDTDKYLEKCVVTGIMRIAKESIFSGLNNPGVYTLTAEDFDDKFGFTEKEVEKLLTDFDISDRYNDVRKWYNGYIFGETVIYNPWSIISFPGG